MNRSTVLLGPLLATIAAGGVESHRPARADLPVPFDELSLTLEANVNDQDGEVVLHVEAAAPIDRLALVAPDGRIMQMVGATESSIGLSEVRLATGEPTLDEVRAAFPEGMYTVRASTLEGEICSGQVELSHDLPSRWAILEPVPDALLAHDAVHVEWTSAPSADHYTLEVEDSTTEIRLVATMHPGQSSFDVPASLLLPDTEYQLVMVAHDGEDNRVVQELHFTTLP